MVKKIVFPNGLRLLLAPRPKALASTVLVLVEAGSEYETKRTSGLSHFLEHMCFKGTVRRPTHAVIANELASLGAANNAFTSQEYTGYWAKAESHKLAQIIDIISDLYLNPIFDPKEIDKERGVIIEELNTYEDTPTDDVHNVWSKLLYGDQPAGWDVGGRKEIIRKLTQEDFLSYRRDRYTPPNTVVVVSGHFRERDVVAAVRERFGHLPWARRRAKPKTEERQTKPQVAVKFKKSDQSHLVLGVRAFDIFDKRRHALQVLSDIVGGGMSSRLFHRVREDLGAAYYIGAGAELLLDHGAFTVSAGVDRNRIVEVMGVIIEELRRLTKDFVPPQELRKTKDHMIGKMVLGLETSDEIAGFYGGQEILTKKLKEPNEVIRDLKAVTAEEIRAVARALFTDRRLNFAVIGPYAKDDSFRRALHF